MCYSYYDHNGTLIANRPTLNLIDGANVTLTATDNPTTNSVDVTVTATVPIVPVADFKEIARVEVGVGGALNILFSSIPDIYSALQLRIYAASDSLDSTDPLNLRFNSGVGNHSDQALKYSFNTTNETSIVDVDNDYCMVGYVSPIIVGYTSFTPTIVDILGYSSSTPTKGFFFNNMIINGVGEGDLVGVVGMGVYRDVSPISSIEISASQNSFNFIEGTKAILYGYA